MRRHAARILVPVAILIAVVAACSAPAQGGGAGSPATNATPAPSIDRGNY